MHAISRRPRVATDKKGIVSEAPNMRFCCFVFGNGSVRFAPTGANVEVFVSFADVAEPPEPN